MPELGVNTSSSWPWKICQSYDWSLPTTFGKVMKLCQNCAGHEVMTELRINIVRDTHAWALPTSSGRACMKLYLGVPSSIGQGHKVMPEIRMHGRSQLHQGGPWSYASITHPSAFPAPSGRSTAGPWGYARITHPSAFPNPSSRTISF